MGWDAIYALDESDSAKRNCAAQTSGVEAGDEQSRSVEGLASLTVTAACKDTWAMLVSGSRTSRPFTGMDQARASGLVDGKHGSLEQREYAR